MRERQQQGASPTGASLCAWYLQQLRQHTVELIRKDRRIVPEHCANHLKNELYVGNTPLGPTL